MTVVLIEEGDGVRRDRTSPSEAADEKVHWRNIAERLQGPRAGRGRHREGDQGRLRRQPRPRPARVPARLQGRRPEGGEGRLPRSSVKTRFYIERLYSEKRVNIVVNRRDWLEEEIEKRRGGVLRERPDRRHGQGRR
ncbi:MAG: hypothetical protein MZU97_12130 [Bacillus subtilis]|nr:hypothetical protein [Bacillus subtilis]